jgi:hypothetical protein
MDRNLSDSDKKLVFDAARFRENCIRLALTFENFAAPRGVGQARIFRSFDRT